MYSLFSTFLWNPHASIPQVFDKVLDLIEDGCKGLVRDLCPDSA